MPDTLRTFKERELKPVSESRPFAFGRHFDANIGAYCYALRWLNNKSIFAWNRYFTRFDERWMIARQLIRIRRQARLLLAQPTSEAGE